MFWFLLILKVLLILVNSSIYQSFLSSILDPKILNQVYEIIPRDFINSESDYIIISISIYNIFLFLDHRDILDDIIIKSIESFMKENLHQTISIKDNITNYIVFFVKDIINSTDKHIFDPNNNCVKFLKNRLLNVFYNYPSFDKSENFLDLLNQMPL